MVILWIQSDNNGNLHGKVHYETHTINGKIYVTFIEVRLDDEKRRWKNQIPKR